MPPENRDDDFPPVPESYRTTDTEDAHSIFGTLGLFCFPYDILGSARHWTTVTSMFEDTDGKSSDMSFSGSWLFDEPLKVVQGKVGSCWLLSAMQVIYRRHPGRASAMVSRVSDGLWQVRLWYMGKQRVIVVDEFLPCAGSSRGSSTLSGVPLSVTADRLEHMVWVSMVEKAVAKLKGTYADLNGGRIDEAFQLLTGMPVDHAVLDKHDSPRIRSNQWSAIVGALKRGAMSSLNLNIGTMSLILRMFGRTEFIHAMGVLDAFIVHGDRPTRMLKLANPWGPGWTSFLINTVLLGQSAFGKAGYCAMDGSITVDFDSFYDHIENVVTCPPLTMLPSENDPTNHQRYEKMQCEGMFQSDMLCGVQIECQSKEAHQVVVDLFCELGSTRDADVGFLLCCSAIDQLSTGTTDCVDYFADVDYYICKTISLKPFHRYTVVPQSFSGSRSSTDVEGQYTLNLHYDPTHCTATACEEPASVALRRVCELCASKGQLITDPASQAQVFKLQTVQEGLLIIAARTQEQSTRCRLAVRSPDDSEGCWTWRGATTVDEVGPGTLTLLNVAIFHGQIDCQCELYAVAAISDQIAIRETDLIKSNRTIAERHDFMPLEKVMN